MTPSEFTFLVWKAEFSDHLNQQTFQWRKNRTDSRVTADNKPPDGLTLTPWREGNPLASVGAIVCCKVFDITGAKLELAASWKSSLYGNLPDSYLFYPNTFKNLGPFNESAELFLVFPVLGNLKSNYQNKSFFLFSSAFCHSSGLQPRSFVRGFHCGGSDTTHLNFFLLVKISIKEFRRQIEIMITLRHCSM